MWWKDIGETSLILVPIVVNSVREIGDILQEDVCQISAIAVPYIRVRGARGGARLLASG